MTSSSVLNDSFFDRFSTSVLELLMELDEPVNQCDAQTVSALAAGDLASLISLLESVRSVPF